MNDHKDATGASHLEELPRQGEKGLVDIEDKDKERSNQNDLASAFVDLTRWQATRTFWRATSCCFLAGVCVLMEGYQGTLSGMPNHVGVYFADPLYRQCCE